MNARALCPQALCSAFQINANTDPIINPTAAVTMRRIAALTLKRLDHVDWFDEVHPENKIDDGLS
jgi:hypothetical protein